MSEPGTLAATPSEAGSGCPACGRTNAPGARFCGACGRPLASASAGPTHVGHDLLHFAREVQREGLPASIFVFVVCCFVGAIGWYPLGFPARVIRWIIPIPTCIDQTTGASTGFGCSTGAAFITMIGPLAVMLAIVLLRGRLRPLLAAAVARVPEEIRFVVLPTFATLLFTISWAGFHTQAAGAVGILPQIIFPGVVGVITYLAVRYEHWLQHHLAKTLEWRDRIPRLARIAVVVAVPAVISYALTQSNAFSRTELKEQFVVLIALVLGWFALAPRGQAALAGTVAP